MELIRLASKDNYREVEKEWKYEFMIYVFEGMGMPTEMLEEYFPESYEDFDVECKLKLRKFLDQEHIEIIENDGQVDYYIGQATTSGRLNYVLIAKWKKCRFVYKKDLSQVNKLKQIYIEVVAEPWVIFENFDEV